MSKKMSINPLNPGIRKYFTDDGILKLNVKYFSASGLNPFIEHNSSPRGLMMSSHVAQIIVINKPEVNMIQTGLEFEFAKYAFMKKTEDPIEILDIIKRYETININKSVEWTIIYKNHTTGEIDVMEIPKFERYHPYFGFEYKFNPILDTLNKGDFINPDTILAKPPTVFDNGEYGFGIDANVCLMTLPGVDEDGFVVSEDFCKRMDYKIYETHTVEFGSNSILLNLYGDENKFKPFPDIGEEINDTGVLCAVRDLTTLEYDDMLLPALMNKYDTMSFNPIFDKATYARKKGKIVDIKLWKNNRLRKEMPAGTYDLLEDYKDAYITFYKKLLHNYSNLKKEYNNYGLELKLSPKLRTLITEAIGIVESDKPNTKLKKTFKKDELDLYRVEFVIEYNMDIGVKNKLSNFHGGKGTIIEIWPTENMPVDEDGVRAEILADPRSIVNRLNIGMLYERHTKAAAVKAKKLLTDKIKEFLNKSEVSKGDITELPDKTVLRLFKDYVLDFVQLINSKQYNAYSELYNKKVIPEIKDILIEIVKDKFYIFLRLDSENRKWEIIWKIKHSKFKPPYGKVKFTYDGKEKISKRNIMIAPIYTILLNKIGDGGLACSSAKTNHFGLPIVVSKKDKNKLPYRNNPVRILGESESRIIVAYGGRYMLAELRDRAANLDTHGEVYKNLILANKPTNVKTLINRKQIAYGEDRPLTLLNSIWKTTGFQLTYAKDKRPYIDYDPSKIMDIKLSYQDMIKADNEIESSDDD